MRYEELDGVAKRAEPSEKLYFVRVELHPGEDVDRDAAYKELYAKMASKGFFRKVQLKGIERQLPDGTYGQFAASGKSLEFAKVVRLIAAKASDNQRPEVMVVEAKYLAFSGLTEGIDEEYLLVEPEE